MYEMHSRVEWPWPHVYGQRSEWVCNFSRQTYVVFVNTVGSIRLI